MATVEAAARLFDRLSAPGYARVCRSETTAKVLAAWHVSRSKGLAATRRALKASPVEPPDLDDFAWGTTFGVWESDARGAVELALERATVEGRLDPSGRNWRTTAAAVGAETLDTPVPGDVGQSWRSLVADVVAIETARHLGTDQWMPIDALARSALDARQRDLAIDVFRAADRPSHPRDHLCRLCKELTGVDLLDASDGTRGR